MALLLRYSPDEGVLRSVGDAPNGILGVAAPNDVATFVIDSRWTSPEIAEGYLNVTARAAPTGISEGSTPISVGDAIDACESERELAWLSRAPAWAMRAAAEFNAKLERPFALLLLQSYVDLVGAMRDALIDRGLLTYTDG